MVAEPRSFPANSDSVCVGGLGAQFSENNGHWILAERTDEITWTSIGYVFTARDAQRIVESWVA